jgi:hypothetical protein
MPKGVYERPKLYDPQCVVSGCGLPTDSLGLCRKHYARWHKNGTTELINRGNKRSHPFYSIWFEKKNAGRLCDEWLDMWSFVEGIGEKPDANAILVRLDEKAPFGPDNFKWLLPLRREPGETIKAFNARKWQSRRQNHPTFERQRHLKRRFGITPADYAKMHDAQEGLCAICKQAETSLHSQTRAPRRLAVDHNHKTKQVRALLCWRCNTAIGRINEDIGLLDAMRAYLVKHLEVAECPTSPKTPKSIQPC